MINAELVRQLAEEGLVTYTMMFNEDGTLKSSIANMKAGAFESAFLTKTGASNNLLGGIPMDALTNNVASALSGKTTYLTKDQTYDISSHRGMGIGQKMNIYLNGNTLTLTGKSKVAGNYPGSIRVQGASSIVGPGKVVYEGTAEDLFWVSVGSLTFKNVDVECKNSRILCLTSGKAYFNGGTYHGSGACILSNTYATANVIEITDGYFSCSEYSGKHYVLNLQDGSVNTFKVMGGSFENMDPSKSGTEPEGNDDNFVAEGYRVVVDDSNPERVIYTVCK